MQDTPDEPARSHRTQYAIALIAPALAVALIATGYAYAEKGVTVVCDGGTSFHVTEAEDIGALLDETGVSIGHADLVTPSPKTPLDDGMTVVVRRAVPVEVVVGDETVEVQVVGETVADAVVAAGLDPGAGMRVDPPLEAPLEPGMSVETADVFVRFVSEETTLPFRYGTLEDPSLALGTRQMVTTGVPGVVISVYEVLVTDGVEGDRVLKTRRLVRRATEQVVAIGTARLGATFAQGPAQVSAASLRLPAMSGREMTVEATAYTPWDLGCGGMKVINRRIEKYDIEPGWGIVAVDPSVIPLGTRMFVPGYGYGVAADTGGAIKGARIDVCFWTGDAIDTAFEWGRRDVTITLLD